MSVQLSGSLRKNNEFSGMFLVNQTFFGLIKFSHGYDTYDGSYSVTPKVESSQVLNTKDRLMKGDVTILEIPYYEVANAEGGTTVIIGGN